MIVYWMTVDLRMGSKATKHASMRKDEPPRSYVNILAESSKSFEGKTSPNIWTGNARTSLSVGMKRALLCPNEEKGEERALAQLSSLSINGKRSIVRFLLLFLISRHQVVCVFFEVSGGCWTAVSLQGVMHLYWWACSFSDPLQWKWGFRCF